MKKVLEVLKNSTIVPKSRSGKDNRPDFWEMYRQVAEEHDSDFLERYFKDVNSILRFVGLPCLSLTWFQADIRSVWSFLHCQLVFHCHNGV
jgi:hypothetical protein